MLIIGTSADSLARIEASTLVDNHRTFLIVTVDGSVRKPQHPGFELKRKPLLVRFGATSPVRLGSLATLFAHCLLQNRTFVRRDPVKLMLSVFDDVVCGVNSEK